MTDTGTTTADRKGGLPAGALPPAYDPAGTEKKWQDFWLEHDLFRARTDPAREPFCIVIPPPNVTGALHMGHALDNTIQDILTRWRRMLGYATLWLPGTDHASIATQRVVLNRLAEQGVTRDELDRESFLEHAWAWKDEYEKTIIGQLQRLGCSCDWSRTRFTMDEGLSRATLTSFVRYYEEGLVYRGDYIVNWCPGCGTAISDIEVEHVETVGRLYHILYPFEDADGGDGKDGSSGRPSGITVATTRPETMLGDVAVAVHPDDRRYTEAVGRTLVLPLLGRRIPVIADEAVDPEFGTGAVKVTPAHDPNDFEIGLRHDLPRVKVIGEDGRMTAEAGPYAGMDRYECREAVLRDLEEAGLLLKVEEHRHAVGHCHRCDSVAEPLVSKQWFVRMKPLAEPAIKAVERGEVKFVPERFKKIYLNWMENIRDWCISRQLWWGHRIPAWYCDECGETVVTLDEPEKCPRCGAGRGSLRQDEDVLDTWFSSALWPFSTLGWPDKTPDLDFFFPTSVLVTAYDIIFFWVARMIFSSYHFMGCRPFEHTFIHGLVRAADGRKMSKSLGTGVDPLETIARYGADALRFSLVMGTAPGNDMRYNDEKVEAARNFANKLWNASRFTLMNLGEAAAELEGAARADLEEAVRSRGELADRWIASRYRRVVTEVNRLLGAFELGEAARALYDFIWSEFCDWYIEMVKPRLYGDDEASRRTARTTLVYVLDGILRLLHPFMPFVTEEIWQRLPALKGEHPPEVGHNPPPDAAGRPRTLVLAPWPAPERSLRDETLEEKVGVIIDVVRSIRNLRAEWNVEPRRRAPVLLITDAAGGTAQAAVEEGRSLIQDLASVSELEVVPGAARRPRHAAAAVTRGVEIYLPLRGLIDLDREAGRLRAELEEATRDLERARAKLANRDFVTKAPPAVVDKERGRAAELEAKCERLSERLAWIEESRAG